jgi:hypothetical protein
MTNWVDTGQHLFIYRILFVGSAGEVTNVNISTAHVYTLPLNPKVGSFQYNQYPRSTHSDIHDRFIALYAFFS